MIKTQHILLLTLLMALGLGMASFASAAYLPVPGALCGMGFPCPEGATGVEMAKSLAGKIVDNVRFVIGAIAILMIIVSGVKLVMAQGNEEEFTKQTHTILYAIAGLFLVGLAGELAMIFEVDRGGFLSSSNVTVQKAKLFNRTVEIIITFIKYIVGSVAVLFVVRSGLKLVLSEGTEEEITKTKHNLLYGIIGLVFIMMANPIINKVFFKIDMNKFPGSEAVRPGIDNVKLAQEIAGMTNIIAAMAGPLALLSFVAGGLMYILAGGEEEKIGKAKKIMIWSAVGLILIYGAFALVGLFVSRQFEGL